MPIEIWNIGYSFLLTWPGFKDGNLCSTRREDSGELFYHSEDFNNSFEIHWFAFFLISRVRFPSLAPSIWMN